MLKRLTILIASFMLILMFSACQGKEPSTKATQIELDSSQTFQILKTKAMQTAQAQLTLASILQPTETPQPRQDATSPEEEVISTLSITEAAPTTIPTLPMLPTYTPWPLNSAYDCRAELLFPSEGQVLNPATAFEARWRLTNSGTLPWDENSVDLVYQDGERMHTTADIIDLNETIAPGGTLDVFITMQTPPQPGSFQTGWVLQRGTLYFCSLNFSLMTSPNP